MVAKTIILFQVIDVLSKLAGLWVNAKKEIMYSQASQITFICPMIFNYFPLDTQVCITIRHLSWVRISQLPLVEEERPLNATAKKECQRQCKYVHWPSISQWNVFWKVVTLWSMQTLYQISSPCHLLLAPQRPLATMPKCSSKLHCM